MITWQIILLPIGLVIIGLIRPIRILRKKVVRLTPALEFLGRFIEWFNGRGQNHAKYAWLIEKPDSVQTMLGRKGVMAFADRLRGLEANNWPIILNALPEINNAFCDRDSGWLEPMGNKNLQLAEYAKSSLHRFIGSAEEQHGNERGCSIRWCCSPVVWLGRWNCR